MTNSGSVVACGVLDVPVVTSSTVYAIGAMTFQTAAAAQTAALDAAFVSLMQTRHPTMTSDEISAVLNAAKNDADAIASYASFAAGAAAGTLAL